MIGPFVIPVDARCTACSGPMTAAAYLGKILAKVDPLALYCNGCGRRAVHCECPRPTSHPWNGKES